MNKNNNNANNLPETNAKKSEDKSEDSKQMLDLKTIEAWATETRTASWQLCAVLTSSDVAHDKQVSKDEFQKMLKEATQSK